MEVNPYSAPQARVASSAPARNNASDPNMKTARAHFALACLYGVCTLIFAVMIFSQASDMPGIVAGIMATLFIGFFCALHYSISWGARRRQNWARIASLVMGFLSILGFPIGTLIGIYLISNAWNEWIEPRVYSGDLTAAWPGVERQQPSSPPPMPAPAENA